MSGDRELFRCGKYGRERDEAEDESSWPVRFGQFRAGTARGIILTVVPTVPVCVECGRRADREARGWQGHIVDADDDGDAEVVFFCPRCAAREFGDLRHRRADPPGR